MARNEVYLARYGNETVGHIVASRPLLLARLRIFQYRPLCEEVVINKDEQEITREQFNLNHCGLCSERFPMITEVGFRPQLKRRKPAPRRMCL